MHVLITGGAGFIGSHLAERHLANGDQVYVVDNLSTGSLANIESFRGNPAFRFAEADILHWNGLDKAVAWADRIYHMAAVVGVKKVLEDPVAVMATNMTGTERILRAIHHGGWNPQVIIASTSEVYGFNEKDSFAETDNIVLPSAGRLRWAYAVTKLADEFLAFSYARKYGLNIVVVRLFNTIGPNQVGPLRHGGAQFRQAGGAQRAAHRLRRRQADALLLRCARHRGGAGSPRRLPGSLGRGGERRQRPGNLHSRSGRTDRATRPQRLGRCSTFPTRMPTARNSRTSRTGGRYSTSCAHSPVSRPKWTSRTTRWMT